jgi:hypothetical protein
MEENQKFGKGEVFTADKVTPKIEQTEEPLNPSLGSSSEEIQSELNFDECRDAINRFDEWFRYAETIGQQRLQSFLQISAILLAVSAAFQATKCRAVYSLPFSLIGIVLSILWYFLGSRQSKFHDMLDKQLGSFLDKHPSKYTFPGYHVRLMKLPTDKRLWEIEHCLSTRKFLLIVPSLFLFVYLFSMAFAIWQIKVEVCQP